MSLEPFEDALNHIENGAPSLGTGQTSPPLLLDPAALLPHYRSATVYKPMHTIASLGNSSSNQIEIPAFVEDVPYRDLSYGVQSLS